NRRGYSTRTQMRNDLATLILVRLHSRRINRNSWDEKSSNAFYSRPLSAILISRRVENREKAPVRPGIRRSTSEEHPPTNLLAVAASVANGRVAPTTEPC